MVAMFPLLYRARMVAKLLSLLGCELGGVGALLMREPRSRRWSMIHMFDTLE
jgi:hypothetical protein